MGHRLADALRGAIKSSIRFLCDANELPRNHVSQLVEGYRLKNRMIRTA